MKYIKTFEEIEDKSKITELDFSHRNLTELPDLSEYINLKILNCCYNKVTYLPELPDSLEKLYCANNQLPFDDLNGYKKWYDENKYIIDENGLKYTYELYCDTKKYNL